MAPSSSKKLNVAVHHANPSFLAALGVPIVAGRAMTLQE